MEAQLNTSLNNNLMVLVMVVLPETSVRGSHPIGILIFPADFPPPPGDQGLQFDPIYCDLRSQLQIGQRAVNRSYSDHGKAA